MKRLFLGLLALALPFGAGGRAHSDPSTLYAGTAFSGVFKSTDGGDSWSPVNNGLTNPWVKSLTSDPTDAATLYAGTDDGIFKTADSGANWSVHTLSGGTGMGALVIDPTTPSTLYAGEATWGWCCIDVCFCEGFGEVFKSTDGGNNWNYLWAGPNIRALAIDPVTTSTVYAAVSYVAYDCSTVGDGVHKTTDGGANWQQAGLGSQHVQAFAIDPSNPSTVYAGVNAPGGMYKSINGAQSWDASNVGVTARRVLVLAMDPTNSSTLYAGTDAGVFKTIDGAASWQEADVGIPPALIYSLAVDPADPNRIYVGTGVNGAFRSVDGGATWSAMNNGLPGGTIAAITVVPN